MLRVLKEFRGRNSTRPMTQQARIMPPDDKKHTLVMSPIGNEKEEEDAEGEKENDDKEGIEKVRDVRFIEIQFEKIQISLTPRGGREGLDQEAIKDSN